MHRKLFTPLAFSFFITKAVVPRARKAGASWREQFHLLGTAMVLGTFSLTSIMFFFASSLFSHDAKRRVREMISPAAREARRKAQGVEQA